MPTLHPNNSNSSKAKSHLHHLTLLCRDFFIDCTMNLLGVQLHAKKKKTLRDNVGLGDLGS